MDVAPACTPTSLPSLHRPHCLPTDASSDYSDQTCSSDGSVGREEEAVEVERPNTRQQRFCLDYDQLQTLQGHLTEQIRGQRITPTSDSMIAELVNKGYLDTDQAKAVVQHLL